jgi:hypothetical protein
MHRVTAELKEAKFLVGSAMLQLLGWPANQHNRLLLDDVVSAIGSSLIFGFPFLINHMRRSHNEKSFGAHPHLPPPERLRIDWVTEPEEGGNDVGNDVIEVD